MFQGVGHLEWGGGGGGGYWVYVPSCMASLEKSVRTQLLSYIYSLVAQQGLVVRRVFD